MPKKIVIVGGVAGGATAAARLRRLDEDCVIVLLERGPDISFANCGLPYHIGGEITRRQKLILQTPSRLGRRYALDIRTRHEVVAIDRSAKTVRVADLESGREYDEGYDYLVLSPGAEPIRPPLPGVDHPRVRTLRNLGDMDGVKAIVDGGATSAVVVGGGFIGLELAEALRHRGLDVTLVELLPQVMPPLDAEMAAPLHVELKRAGVKLLLGDAVTEFAGADGGRVAVTLRSGVTLSVDVAALAVGVRPESGLAREAGLELNERGAIVVDEYMRTADPSIYAVGDAVEVRDAVFGGPAMIPLAGPANRQGRIAADNICGRSLRYRGTQGTSILRVFNLTAGLTGLSEKTLKQRGVAYHKVYVQPKHHVGYFPGARSLLIKLLFAQETGRVLGGQVVGAEGIDKRVDVLAMAVQAGMTVGQLEEAELAYAPPFGAAKDPINVAGFVGANVLRGDVECVYAEELGAAARSDWTVVDVRQPSELESSSIPGALSIPLPELRERWGEIPRDKPIALCCTTGQRSYYAYRTLRQKGVACKNLMGGLTVFYYTHVGAADVGSWCAPPMCGA